tara:strand:+ start:341 stop:1435 length:1095 start_codon:yes stop_codon:yes gene_type:complete
MGIRNFGIGLGLSPYKQEEEEKKNDDKPKKEVKEYGGNAKQPDKGWVKALKAGVTMLSHGLASVYGGTAHTPKINWGKRKKEKEALPDTEDLLKNIENKTDIDKNTEKPEMNFASQAEGNEFRAWVNKTYPEYAKKEDLDPSGSHTNSYIRKAWEQYGKEFNDTKSPAKMMSPLNKRGKRGTATKGKSTATRKRRGGFTKGGKKAGDRNMGQYNVQTRFSPRAAQPIKGGVTSSGGGGGGAPYSFDKMGNMIFSPTINNIVGGNGKQLQKQEQEMDMNYEWVPPEYGTRTITGKLPTYREAWDKNNKNVQSKYKTFEDFKAAAIAWNKKHGGGSTSKTETYKIKDGYYRPIGGTMKQSQYQEQS